MEQTVLIKGNPGTLQKYGSCGINRFSFVVQLLMTVFSLQMSVLPCLHSV